MDPIDRQDVIDALRDWHDGMIISSFRGIEKVIKALPSAQPEERTEERTETHACDCISRQGAIDADELMELLTTAIRNMKGIAKFIGAEDDPEIKMKIKAYTDIANRVKDMPTIEPERKKNTIQKFHDYQVEWLKSHYDIELEPQLEEMIVRFLHDMANCYMMEIDREEGERER